MKLGRYAIAPVAVGVALVIGAGAADAQAGCFTRTFPGITSCGAFDSSLRSNPNNYNISGCYGQGSGFAETWWQRS